MELDFDDSVVRGLLRYVRLVSQALDLRGECSYVQADEVAHAYVALDGWLPRFPGCDVALLWDEIRGWAAAVEDPDGGEPRVVARLDADVRPAPEAVASWVRSLWRDRSTGHAARNIPSFG